MSQRECPVCGRGVRPDSVRCPHCGADFVELAAAKNPRPTPPPAWLPVVPEPPPPPVTPAQRSLSLDERQARVILTTAPTLEGFRIVRTIEIVTAECVFGLNLFKDFFAGVRDLVGGRSAATQEALRNARRTCLTELRRAAVEVDANAVIAVDLDYSEFSGQGKSMLFLVASGTAVKVEPLGDHA